MTPSHYDFVVVGGGPAGCAVASGLANSSKKPSVLLLEAGGPNEDRNLRVDGQRWITFMNKDMNWGYKTSPQEHADGRECDYSRGKGLGGSSAINFGVYTVGARDDYEEWARIVGDVAFRWEKIQPRFKKLETFHGELPAGVDPKYAAPKEEDHGKSGKLRVGYASEWERDLPPVLDLFDKAGFPLNPDHNSGNPLGMSVLINSSNKGLRSTANDLLTPKPDNLTIITDSAVQRVLLEGTKAIGVESNGKTCKYFLPANSYWENCSVQDQSPSLCCPTVKEITQANDITVMANKEVILSAGSLDTPKILMHSGIGPKDQLEQYGIPVVKDVPSVGQGLKDHMFTPLVYTRKPGDTDRQEFYGDKIIMDEAMDQWKKDGTGPWTKFACEMGVGWFKLDKLAQTEEFKALPTEVQEFLNKETIPHYEILTHFPIHWFIPGFPDSNLNYSCLLVFYFNAQARGEVTLQSSDPNAPLKFDPKFLGTPFDRRVAIESLRDAFRVAKSEGYTQDNVAMLAGPQGDSDEDLLAYWRATISSSWHMTGTTKMGKKTDDDAVVDSNFKVFGFENLRIVDSGVVPVLASCHIQSVAYVTGATAAEKLITEYDLS